MPQDHAVIANLGYEQNDPTELLEVLDGRGNATGRAVTRKEIHLAGLWHRAFHCWILRGSTDEPEIVLQRRSRFKDTFPGRWDAAAAGHWRFGETAEQAAREVAEELGLQVDFGQLRWIGRERVSRRHPNGLVDRELHEVYALWWQAPLVTYRPDPAEVSAIAALPATALLALVGGSRTAIRATEALDVRSNGSVCAASALIERANLVPYSAARLRRLLAGIQSA